MILVCAADDFQNFGKFGKSSTFKNSYKICHKQNVKCLVVFKSTRQVCNHMYLNSIKKTELKTLIFFKKVDFCIFELKNREVIENSSKTSLNFCPLQCTYLGKYSFQYH